MIVSNLYNLIKQQVIYQLNHVSLDLVKVVREAGVDSVGDENCKEAAKEGDQGEDVEVEAGELGRQAGENQGQLRG